MSLTLSALVTLVSRKQGLSHIAFVIRAIGRAGMPSSHGVPPFQGASGFPPRCFYLAAECFLGTLEGSILQQKNSLAAKDFIAPSGGQEDDCRHGKARPAG
jgi:hypothetical protein